MSGSYRRGWSLWSREGVHRGSAAAVMLATSLATSLDELNQLKATFLGSHRGRVELTRGARRELESRLGGVPALG